MEPLTSESGEVAESIRADAVLFGRMQRGGNWAIAFLVARNCEKSKPGPRSNTNIGTNVPKVSCRRFSELAGCSYKTVIRYLEQWDRAADAGVVSPSYTLEPGVDLEPEALPDENKSEDPKDWWSTYKETKRVEAEHLREATPAETRHLMETLRQTTHPYEPEPTEDELEERDDPNEVHHDLGLPPGVRERRVTRAGANLLETNEQIIARAAAMRNVTPSAEQVHAEAQQTILSQCCTLIDQIEQLVDELAHTPIPEWDTRGVTTVQSLWIRLGNIRSTLADLETDYALGRPNEKEDEDGHES